MCLALSSSWFRTSASHAEDHGFESRQRYQFCYNQSMKRSGLFIIAGLVIMLFGPVKLGMVCIGAGILLFISDVSR